MAKNNHTYTIRKISDGEYAASIRNPAGGLVAASIHGSVDDAVNTIRGELKRALEPERE